MQPDVRLIQSTQEVLRTDSLAPIAASTAFNTLSQPEQHVVSSFGSRRTFAVVTILAEEAATARVALRDAFSVSGGVHLDTLDAALQLGGITYCPSNNLGTYVLERPAFEASQVVSPLRNVGLQRSLNGNTLFGCH
jgi:hypothetical protein